MGGKKVLLIAINARFSHPNPALFYLRSYISDLGYEILIREFTIQASPEDISRYILEENPDVCAISVYIWNTILVKGLLKRLESMERCTVILGGPEVSYNPGEWHAEHSRVDYIITGHGEEGFRRLALEGFAGKEKTIHSSNPPFSEISFPYREEDLSGFKNRNIYYESSRGCPFRCAYCLSSRSDQALQYRTLPTVMEELGILIKTRPRLIKFIDRTFNADRNRAGDIWRFLMERHPDRGTSFHFEIHPSLLADDDLSLLAGAPPGLFEFEIGIQSTHDDVLEAIGRKGSWSRITERIARLIAGKNISTHLDLIAGLPFENIRMLRESFNRVYLLGADHFQLGTLKVLPGTEIRERAGEFGLLYGKNPPYEVIETRWLNQEDMALVKKIARLLDAVYNPGRFRTTLSELLPCFDDPWSFFGALAGRFHDTEDASWERMYLLLTELADERVPDEADYLRDCLAWDWFTGFHSHRIPALIRNDAIRRARSRIRSLAERGGALPEGVSDWNILRQGRIFSPETSRFSEKYMKGKSVAVFTGALHEPVLL